ncbi:hypothetical protein SK128_012655 [Halocaridina rubra]|uniref:Chitin-binding type-2 domain-containing protein n=1 Tax=Halocaridina rubra TaxID=373956 RepID=A0AAN8X8D7_HALRR
MGVAIDFARDVCDTYDNQIANSIIDRVPSKSQFFRMKGNVPSLSERLIDNFTTVRENIVDSFSCQNRVYGYYADQDNDCQIFHICVPMQQLFPDLYCADDVFQFSFICPKHTVFSQESMVCDWADSAFPCSEADKLYDRNKLFFVVPEEDVQRESAFATTTPTSAPSESLCCSSRQQIIEARHSIRDSSQFSFSSSNHEESSYTFEIPKTTSSPHDLSQTTLPNYFLDTKSLPTTSSILEIADDITTWPTMNQEAIIYSAVRQSITDKEETEPDSQYTTESFLTADSEAKELTHTTFLPETTLPELTTLEPDDLWYFPTSPPIPQTNNYLQAEQIPSVSTRSKIRRSGDIIYNPSRVVVEEMYM